MPPQIIPHLATEMKQAREDYFRVNNMNASGTISLLSSSYSYSSLTCQPTWRGAANICKQNLCFVLLNSPF